LSDHPGGRTAIASGPFAGKQFGDVLRAHPLAMIGSEQAPARYPLLVKAIDAAEDLSIQVHPDDARAPRGDRGKTECWYIIDCDPDAQIIHGVDPDATLEDLQAAAADGSLPDAMARFAIEPGDFLFVPAGTVHAILGGTLVCEIQQSSDTTYRLWDWGREPARELHLEQSWEVIDLSEAREPVITPQVGAIARPIRLVECEFFRVWALDVAPGKGADLGALLAAEREGEPIGALVLCAVAGSAKVVGEQGEAALPLGGCVFLPACCKGAARAVATGGATTRILLAESLEL
jgi:mannose-6-phosphate isomerase